MSKFKYLRKIIPELNYWVNRILFNNSFNKDYLSCPTKISDFWRSRDSVVELIFNETDDPSGAEYDDGYHFIWKYRTVNLKKLHLYEPMLFKRIQVYYNSSWVYAAKDDPKFQDIFNLNDSSVTYDDQNYEYPYSIKPTEYVNYTSHIVGTGTDELHYDDPKTEPPEPQPDDSIIYVEAENVFGLTEEELKMCEYLYYYRTMQLDKIDIDPEWYNTLQSPLSIWILTYLLCYVKDYVDFNHVVTFTTESDLSFRCLCEKHLQQRVYEYVQKKSMILWENILETNGKDRRSFKNYTLVNKNVIQRGRLTQENISCKCIDIDAKYLAHTEDFEFILDGLCLKNTVDYRIVNTSKESEPSYKIRFLTNKLTTFVGCKYQFMFNETSTKNPITGINSIDSNS